VGHILKYSKTSRHVGCSILIAFRLTTRIISSGPTKKVIISMISDLNADTIRWVDEIRRPNNTDYKLSNTHRLR
jgi:hypothetical protein